MRRTCDGLFQHWELRSDVIGKVTDDGYAHVRDGDQEVARAPVTVLTNPPEYRRRGRGASPIWNASSPTTWLPCPT